MFSSSTQAWTKKAAATCSQKVVCVFKVPQTDFRGRKEKEKMSVCLSPILKCKIFCYSDKKKQLSLPNSNSSSLTPACMLCSLFLFFVFFANSGLFALRSAPKTFWCSVRIVEGFDKFELREFDCTFCFSIQNHFRTRISGTG